MAELRQRRARMEAAIRREEHRRRNASKMAGKRQIAGLRDATDDTGQPRYPHADKVMADMVALMRSGAATSIEDAYERALWMDPTTRKDRQDEIESARIRDARRFGFADGMDLTRQVLNRWKEIREGNKEGKSPDRITLVVPIEGNPMAVLELRRHPGEDFWRIVSSGVRANWQLGEIIFARP